MGGKAVNTFAHATRGDAHQSQGRSLVHRSLLQGGRAGHQAWQGNVGVSDNAQGRLLKTRITLAIVTLRQALEMVSLKNIADAGSNAVVAAKLCLLAREKCGMPMTSEPSKSCILIPFNVNRSRIWSTP
jgi:hypothetical protein